MIHHIWNWHLKCDWTRRWHGPSDDTHVLQHWEKQAHVYLKSYFLLLLAFSVTLVLYFYPHILFLSVHCVQRSYINVANFTLGLTPKALETLWRAMFFFFQLNTWNNSCRNIFPTIRTLITLRRSFVSSKIRQAFTAQRNRLLRPQTVGATHLISNSRRYYITRRSGVGWKGSNKQCWRRQSESQRDCQRSPSRLRAALSSQIRVRLLPVSSFWRRWLISTHAVFYRWGPTQ